MQEATISLICLDFKALMTERSVVSWGTLKLQSAAARRTCVLMLIQKTALPLTSLLSSVRDGTSAVSCGVSLAAAPGLLPRLMH